MDGRSAVDSNRAGEIDSAPILCQTFGMNIRSARTAERLASRHEPLYLRVDCACQSQMDPLPDPSCDVCDGQGHVWTLEPGLVGARYSDRLLIELLQPTRDAVR